MKNVVDARREATTFWGLKNTHISLRNPQKTHQIEKDACTKMVVSANLSQKNFDAMPPELDGWLGCPTVGYLWPSGRPWSGGGPPPGRPGGSGSRTLTGGPRPQAPGADTDPLS